MLVEAVAVLVVVLRILAQELVGLVAVEQEAINLL
jgi:hypothetical protein